MAETVNLSEEDVTTMNRNFSIDQTDDEGNRAMGVSS